MLKRRTGKDSTQRHTVFAAMAAMAAQIAHKKDMPHLVAFTVKHFEARAGIMNSSAISKGGA